MTFKKLAVLMLTAIALCTSGAKAQDSMAGMSMPVTNVNDQNLVKGSDSPNSIPRLLIARLWFHAQTATPAGITDPDFGVPSVGFTNPSDATVLTNALIQYQKSQIPADASYNKLVLGSSISPNARDNYWNSHNNLVANILSGLTLTLTPDGLQQFYTFLESKKTGAYVSPIDSALSVNPTTGISASTLRKELSYVAGSPQNINGMNGNYSILLQSAIVAPLYSSFDYLNRTSFGTPWVGIYGTWSDSVAGGAKATSGGADGEAAILYEDTVYNDQNQCVSTTLVTLPATDTNIGPTVHMSTNRQNGYFFFIYSHAGAYGLELGKLTNGTYSAPAGLSSYYTGFSPAAGDVLTVCAMGTGPLVHLTGAVQRGSSVIGDNTYDDANGILTGYPGIMSGVGGGSVKNFSVSTGHRLHTQNSLSGDSICPSSCPPGVTHQAQVHAKIGTQGQIVLSAKVIPTSYLSAVANDDIIIEPIQPTDVWDFVAEVICTQVGQFLATTDSPNPGSGATWKPCWTIQPGSSDGECSTFWLADTPSFTVGILGSGTNVQWIQEINCTPTTDPPDYVPTDLTVPYSGSAEAMYSVTGKTPYNFEYHGICVAPPLGNHAGQFYCVSEGPMGGLLSINPTWKPFRDSTYWLSGQKRQTYPCTHHHNWYIP